MTYPDTLMTKADVAKLLRCCERTLERQFKQGTFPPPQKFGKESLWFQSVVHGWLNMRREQQMQWAGDTGFSIVVEPVVVAVDAATPPSQTAPKKPRASRVKARPGEVEHRSIFSATELSCVDQLTLVR